MKEQTHVRAICSVFEEECVQNQSALKPIHTIFYSAYKVFCIRLNRIHIQRHSKSRIQYGETFLVGEKLTRII